MSDPEALVGALPGVEELETDECDGRVSARALPGTALGTTPFDLRLWVRERREGEHATIDGRGRSGENGVEFTIALDLRDEGEGCGVAWTGWVVFHGVLASVAQRVLPSLVSEQVERVLLAAAGQAAGSRS
jgi:carbon monoxide dehydrogenase subunit G